eukprot:CAMPEP_0195517380 /NCGR_PEP_ID=MMETSP0794_2-20130614/10628_1 /TAXON_ID=515487 /ORGANISM="Stephanopyxis turris, Strain CCMP 815" /LENGTH=404 /DNA_ID=CAMNT_0040646177 /DNA_START=353 /DNA_END=1567 /DNA_ORIENTATION=+
MIHCRVDPSTCVESFIPTTSSSSTTTNTTSTGNSTKGKVRKQIMKDGTIKIIHDDTTSSSSGKDLGFRKGMLPLRDMKMHWTLSEFTEMDNQYTFKIKRQEEAWAKSVSLDSASCAGFQSYLREFNFQRQRFGFLYGTFLDVEEGEDGEGKTRVKVEAIYEPPQEADPNSPEGFVPLEDEHEEKVEELAKMLGLKRVGWIFGHPPREDGFQMSAAEVVMAAEFQLEAAEGVNPTPFVSVKVTVGTDGNASFEAFQMSKQCMEMVAEGALEVGPQPGFCNVNETFTVIQEGKESKNVENNFFLTLVPIEQHDSEMFVCQFPKANRDHGVAQTHDEMKRQLSKSGSQGWNFIDLLSDFGLLLFLSNFLDFATDMPKICKSVVNRDVPLDEGYKIIIASMAGMDGSY